MKVKNLLKRLKDFDPEANIYFTLDLNSEVGYPILEVIKLTQYQLVGLIKND